LALLATLLAPPPAGAQSKTTAALTGVVKDATGAVLPGAGVTISSPALIGGARTAATDGGGRFRFPEIAAGEYTVEIALSGFQGKRFERVVLVTGQTTDLPVSLELEAVSESVVVVADAAVLDPSSSASNTSLDSDYLQNLPTPRFQPDVLNLAPGINMGSAFGGGGESANAYQIDGVDTSDPDGGTPWSFVNYNIVQEVQLVGLGAPAEYGSFTGIVFNSVTRSGGNQVAGLAEALYTDESLVSSNSDDPLINPTTKRQIDSTAQIGGPLVADRLWYFLSGQYFKDESTSGGPLRTEESPRVFTKLSWQPTSSTNIEGWIEWDRYDITGRGGDTVTPLEATVTESAPEYVWNLSWRSVLSANTIFNLSYGGYTGYYYLDPQSGYGVPGHYDGLTGLYSVNSTYFYKADRTRNQVNASISHYADDFIKGSHDFKFGMELERSTLRNRYGYTTGVWLYDNYYWGYDDPGTEDYDPAYYVTLQYSGSSYDVNASIERASLFAQDSWKITPRLTVNAGVRMELNRGKVSGHTVYKNQPIAPRLGFAWDAGGDGKTIVKGHYGRYFEKLVGAQFYWVDPNAFEDGEQTVIYPSGATEVIAHTAGSRYSIDPNLKHQYLDQYLIGIDHEFGGGLSMGLSLVRRENKDFIETVSRDGVFVPVTGTVEETGRQVTLFDYLNPDEDTLIVTNPPGLHRKYEAAIFTVTKRLRDRWQLEASYIWSRARGNIDNLDGFNSAYGGNNPGRWLDTPNSLVFAEGTLSHDQKSQVKLQGTYMIPKVNLNLSANYTYYSGDTYNLRSNCLLVDGDCYRFNQGSFRFFGEPRGVRRLKAKNEIDLRAEWGPPLGDGHLGVMLDVFNVTNQGRATLVEDRSGSSFEAPLEWNFPRTYRLGVRYSF
jgi:outer membrane receptor protein involved in Fe transport